MNTSHSLRRSSSLAIVFSFAALASAVLAALVLTTATANAETTYTWTGGAGSGSNWHDPGNWDANGVPTPDNDSLGAANSADTIIFNSATASGNYMPGAAIAVWNLPNLTLANGTLNLTYPDAGLD